MSMQCMAQSVEQASILQQCSPILYSMTQKIVGKNGFQELKIKAQAFDLISMLP